MKRARDDDAIVGLVGRWADLHPFHPSAVLHRRQLYPSLEHAYAAAVAGDSSDADKLRARLRGEGDLARAPGAAEAKALLHACSPATLPLAERLTVMRNLLRDKMMRHDRAKQVLLETGGAHIVHSDDTADATWGLRDGTGSNHLGRLLETVRLEIASGKQVSSWLSTVCETPHPAQRPRVRVRIRRKGAVVDDRNLDGSRPFFTVGKFDSSDFVLQHVSCSRRHALLAFDRASLSGLSVIDLASKAGTLLSGRPVPALIPTDVASGTELIFGVGSSRAYIVEVDQSAVIGSLEKQRAALDAEIRNMQTDVADEASLFGLVPSKRVDPAKTSVFVGNLPYEVDAADVQDLMEAYGPVTRVHMPTDRETESSRGYCFVHFGDARHAHAARALHGQEFAGRSLRVELAEPPGGGRSGQQAGACK